MKPRISVYLIPVIENMAVNTAARIWSPYKELYHTVESAILRKIPDAIQDLEVSLKRHKPDFLSLLKNPAKNSVHREEIKKADVHGLPIQGQQTTQVLSQQFIQEALIISDLFDLNEYAAVELLMAGENQQPYFPGLTRGLVAVLLYYDGRVSLVNSLRALIQSRQGRTWSLELPHDLSMMTTKFTDQLMEEGLANRILELLNDMDITKELDQLQQQRALGHAKHRKQMTDKLSEIQTSLAESLFCWCAQMPLKKQELLRLIQHLRGVEGLRADGTLDDVTTCLLMALLYSIDVRVLEQEDTDDLAVSLPVLLDETYLPEVHREVVSMQAWKNPGLKAVLKFGWAIMLRSLPQYINNPDVNEYLEQDELLVDQAIQENVFFFLNRTVTGADIFYKEKFFITQLHNMITDFIDKMPLKVKELRNSGDETARIIVANQQEGLEPPEHLPRYFEHLLMLIGDLYGKDSLGLELPLDYWYPTEPSQQTSFTGLASMYQYRPPQRQISLYKFVRLAGDLLPPPLYVPYIKMLTGLANGPRCAHHCYNLLKSNGVNAGGHANAVSWDHFFLSMNRYYTNLRQESGSMSDMSHIYSRHHIRGITPQELDGLVCVLELITAITQQDEYARIALCENQQWLPLVVLLGLVGCSVPPQLKAQLLKTLAALAKSPEIASSLWQSIEVSQILPTVSSSLHQQPGGIQVELDEVEARNEDFPMTLAFLELMNMLTDNPIPAGLGAGYRVPGFQPYLDFLRDSVFLKFNTRAYKKPEQKWSVASGVLSILYKLLQSHEVQLENFIDQPVEMPGEGVTLLNKPPGHSLMLHLLNDSAMLRMILFIVDEATKLLDKYIDFAGKSHLEAVSLTCLNLIRLALEKQEAFLTGLRESGASVMVSPMDKLLMGINPRSGKADHLVNIAKYVVHNPSLPEHALCAVKILCGVTRSPLVQPKIVGLFTATEELSVSLLNGFVECLECSEPEEQDLQNELTDEDPSVSHVRNLTRQHILLLLLQTLDQPAPNLAHFLLGYELTKPVSKTNLQDPGVLGSPRTCLHSALSVLDSGVETRTGPSCLQETPRLAELCYHLMYMLCANRDTSTPTMRYLRTTHDFLIRHLQHVPFQLPESVKQTTQGDSLLLSQQSWLLKSVALELKLTSSNRQRSHTQRLMNLLLDDNPQAQQKGPDGVYEPEFSQYESEFSLYTSTIQTHPGLRGSQTKRKILAILDAIEFTQEYPPPLQLEFFNNPGAIEQAIRGIEEKNEYGVVQGDVKLLFKMLMNEVNNMQGAATGQRQLMIQEVQMICANLVERNAFRQAIYIKKQAFDAWRQVIEIILTACPADLLQGEARQNILFEVLQDLLMKVSKEDVVPELSSLVAGVILTLMANLRQCFLTDQSALPTEVGHSSQYVSLLDGTSSSHMTGFGGVTGARTLYSSSLQVVLRGLIEYLMRSSSSSQRVRANLYGALLYYLQIAQKPTTHSTDTGRSVESKLTSGDVEYEKLMQENLDTISGYGDNVMETICRDACDGHDVGRMLSMATLDSMLSMDKRGSWLNFMTSKGYLQHIIGSMAQDDEQLHSMLTPNPGPLRALYIFESKMALLTRVAESATGAHTLIQCGLMARLAECSILDVRPEGDTRTNSFIPAVLTRYRHQILFPVLKLCLAVLTSLGIENRQAAHKVLQFIIAHIDMFTNILREKQAGLEVESLKELSLVTAVVSRAALDESEGDAMSVDTATIEFRGHMTRLQRQMIALLSRYCLTEKMYSELRELAPEKRLGVQVALVEISSNVVAFCRTIISKSGVGSQVFRVLFGPSLIEAMSRDLVDLDDLQSSVSASSHPHNLGLVVYMLRQATDHFLRVFEEHKLNKRKLGNVVDLSNEELKELCGVEGGEKMSAQQRHHLARHRLTLILTFTSQLMQLYSYIIENCLYILWKQLNFYLVHCIPAESTSSLYRTHQRQTTLRRLQDSASSPFPGEEEQMQLHSGVSREDLQLLKRDAVNCVNESLFKKLHEIEQSFTKERNRYGFMEALVRRLKRLLTLHTGPA